MKRTRQYIEKDIAETREKLEDARKRLPYHSVRPHQLMEVEDLEDRLAELESELESAE